MKDVEQSMARRLTSPINALTVFLAIVLLTLSIMLWQFGGSRFVTAMNINLDLEQRNTSNISREQYDAALAKWNNLHVTDYEATVQVSNQGKWKIGVHVDNAYGSAYAPGAQATYAHRIVLFESLDNRDVVESEKVDVYDHAAYEYATVGGLFDDVNDMLACQENSCADRHWFTPTRYIVEFDETMGYPSSVTSINEYATVETRIENVKVLK